MRFKWVSSRAHRGAARLRLGAWAVVVGVGAWMQIGCAAAHVKEPVTSRYGSNDDHAQFEFWQRLSAQPLASNDDTFHALLLYTDERDPANDYAGRVSLLKQRKILPADFNRPADEAINRGVLAVAAAQVLHIKGGLMMHLTGNNPRYALLELQDMNLFPASSENQTFSGSEVVGIISKMEDYQHGDTSNLPASQLTFEAGGAGGGK